MCRGERGVFMPVEQKPAQSYQADDGDGGVDETGLAGGLNPLRVVLGLQERVIVVVVFVGVLLHATKDSTLVLGRVIRAPNLAKCAQRDLQHGRCTGTFQ